MTFFALRGDKALIAKLNKLDKGVRNKTGRQALRAGAKVIGAEVKSRAPKKSGRLAKAVKVRAGKRKRVGGEPRLGVNVQIGLGSYIGKTFYGAFKEYGNKLGKRKSRKRHGKRGKKRGFVVKDDRKQLPGLHFMKKSVQAKQGAAMDAAKAVIKRGIAEAAK